MNTADILIKNAMVLTFDQEMHVIENGCIAIIEKQIAEIGTILDMNDWQGREVIDASDMLVLPGLVNGHTHAGMSYFKGMADDMPVIRWLNEKIWPAEAKYMNAEFVRLGVEHAAAEMIRSGITTFSDMYFYSHEAATSCEVAGIRAVIGEGVIDYPVAMHQGADDMINYVTRLHKENKNDLITFAIAPHAIYTCNKDNLKKALKNALDENMLLHIHLSETQEEVEACTKEHGKLPVEYLDGLGIFEAKTLLAHGIHLEDRELEILHKRGVSIAVNTISNLKLASGFAPIHKYEQYHVNYCLGTDGVASNNKLDMFSEISTTARLHKALNRDASFLPAKHILQKCINGGAKALDLDEKIGSLEVGKLADMIMIDMNTIDSQPVYDPYSHLVYCTSTEQVKNVIINGKIVMKNRKLLTLDEDILLERAKGFRKRIQQ